jgi:hypothetical protein
MPIEPLHTHYDNLKVSRRAPIEVIRASYKAMAQKYHPDLNGGNAESQRIMTLLNQSYEVLSDPVKRAAHDAWILQAEAPSAPSGQATQTRSHATSQVNVPNPAIPVTVPASSPAGGFMPHVQRYWFFYLILGIWVWYINIGYKPSENSAVSTEALPQKLSAKKPAYVKPAISPLGNLWPQSAAYVKGYKVLAQPGLSTVTIDNTSNDNDVFVKLMSLDFGAPMPARHFFIPSHSQFTLKNVMAGNYDIRYKDLDSGQLARSESFTLEETPSYNGTTYSNLRMTLYKVRNGNMQTYGIGEADFGE